MTIAPQATKPLKPLKCQGNALSDIDRKTVAHALMCAQNAIRDLGASAADGTRGRPTIATLNRTMERLASIETLLKQVLA